MCMSVWGVLTVDVDVDGNLNSSDPTVFSFFQFFLVRSGLEVYGRYVIFQWETFRLRCSVTILCEELIAAEVEQLKCSH